MKYSRKAIPTGSRNLEDAIEIYFEDPASRELVDKDGNPIDVSALPVEQQNAIARWEDDFEDGLNEFDGEFEISRGCGMIMRRRAWRVE